MKVKEKKKWEKRSCHGEKVRENDLQEGKKKVKDNRFTHYEDKTIFLLSKAKQYFKAS